MHDLINFILNNLHVFLELKFNKWTAVTTCIVITDQYYENMQLLSRNNGK